MGFSKVLFETDFVSDSYSERYLEFIPTAKERNETHIPRSSFRGAGFDEEDIAILLHCRKPRGQHSLRKIKSTLRSMHGAEEGS